MNKRKEIENEDLEIYYNRATEIPLGNSKIYHTSNDDKKNYNINDKNILENNKRCFNCGNPKHSVQNCPEKKDKNRINFNRNQFMIEYNKESNTLENKRYYVYIEISNMKPGDLSNTLRKALDMKPGDLPPWYQRMHIYGPPPYFSKNHFQLDNFDNNSDNNNNNNIENNNNNIENNNDKEIINKKINQNDENEWREAWTENGDKYWYNIITYETTWYDPYFNQTYKKEQLNDFNNYQQILQQNQIENDDMQISDNELT